MHAKILKTKQALLSTLIHLLESTGLQDISVSQLCKEAGINRTTFYKYYSLPEDVIVEFVETILGKMLSFEQTPPLSLEEHLVMVCQLVYENREIMGYYAGIKGELSPLFIQYALKQRSRMSFLANPRNLFIAGGVSSSIMGWVMENFPQSPEALAHTMAEQIALLQPDSKE